MKKNKLLLLVTALVYLFLIGPLLVIMAASFSDTNYLKFPGEGFTLKWYQQVFTMSAFASAAKLSVLIALGGTAIALALGLPAAYALNRYDFKGKDIIKTVFLSPVLIPCIVLGFIMLAVAFVLGIIALVQKISGVALGGFTTVILLLLFSASVIMISLGIIGYYIARIYDEIKGRPRYIISRICGREDK